MMAAIGFAIGLVGHLVFDSNLLRVAGLLWFAAAVWAESNAR